jgi:hypothetical protein
MVFLVVPENQFYDPKDYAIDKSVSSSSESENFSQHIMHKENTEHPIFWKNILKNLD